MEKMLGIKSFQFSGGFIIFYSFSLGLQIVQMQTYHKNTQHIVRLHRSKPQILGS